MAPPHDSCVDESVEAGRVLEGNEVVLDRFEVPLPQPETEFPQERVDAAFVAVEQRTVLLVVHGVPRATKSSFCMKETVAQHTQPTIVSKRYSLGTRTWRAM